MLGMFVFWGHEAEITIRKGNGHLFKYPVYFCVYRKFLIGITNYNL